MRSVCWFAGALQLQLLQLLEEQLQPVSSLTRLHARVVGALDIELASLVKSEVCSKLAGGRGLAMVKLADEGVQQLLKDPQPGQPQPVATLCANVVADRIAAAIKVPELCDRVQLFQQSSAMDAEELCTRVLSPLLLPQLLQSVTLAAAAAAAQLPVLDSMGLNPLAARGLDALKQRKLVKLFAYVFKVCGRRTTIFL